MKTVIETLMFGWQQHFRVELEFKAGEVFDKLLPALGRPTVTVVGVRCEGSHEAHAVCVEPADREPNSSIFNGIEADIATIEREHPWHKVIDDDARAMAQKPRHIRVASIRQAVQQRLTAFDAGGAGVSFVGLLSTVGEYEVMPVFRFDRARFESLPHIARELVDEQRGFSFERSLHEAALGVLIWQARLALSVTEPGEPSSYLYPSADEILRNAGRNLMSTPPWAADRRGDFGTLFDACNVIASMPHESRAARGRIVIAQSNHPTIESVVTFATPAPLSQHGWVRKLVEMARGDVCLLSDGVVLSGLARLKGTYDAAREDLFTVTFVSQHVWELRHDAQVLMRVELGVPTLPRPKKAKDAFCHNIKRVFRGVKTLDADAIWNVVESAMSQAHGTIVVIHDKAADEARRLCTQATPIVPTLLDAVAVERVTSIDGAVLLDSAGVCHAVGVILDGLASEECTPARGARYNSAVRFVGSAKGTPKLAVVVSEDGNVDVLPTLQLELPRSELEGALANAQAVRAGADLEALHRVVVWFDRHRFYLDAAAAALANEVRDAYEQVPADGYYKRSFRTFVASVGLDDSYFV